MKNILFVSVILGALSSHSKVVCDLKIFEDSGQGSEVYKTNDDFRGVQRNCADWGYDYAEIISSSVSLGGVGTTTYRCVRGAKTIFHPDEKLSLMCDRVKNCQDGAVPMIEEDAKEFDEMIAAYCGPSQGIYKRTPRTSDRRIFKVSVSGYRVGQSQESAEHEAHILALAQCVEHGFLLANKQGESEFYYIYNKDPHRVRYPSKSGRHEYPVLDYFFTCR